MLSDIASIVAFHRRRTTRYRPQTHGIIECAHSQLKTTLIARKETWLQALPIILMGILSALNSPNTSSFFTVTGRKIMIPQLLVDDTNDKINDQKFDKELQRT